MAAFEIKRNADTCIGCNECFVVCPQSVEGDANSVITPAKTAGDPPEVRNADNCIQCFRCSDYCRTDAITFENAHRVEIIIHDETAADAVRRMI